MSEMPRRDFVALSVTAGLAATSGSAEAAVDVVETNVEIKMPDGTCDAAFIHPKTGSHPGVLLWPDAFGLRPAMREMGKRLAAEGYSVLVPNPFYRVSKAPFTDASNFDFGKPEDRAKLQPLMGSVNAAGNPEKDAAAYIAFLDAQKEVDKAKKVGTQGYCMGGPLAFRTAAAVPDRVGAVASFHGGGLVAKDNPNSPHLLAAKTKAQFLIAIAANDDMSSPTDKTVMKDTFATAKLPAEIEVYPAMHGWCPPDSGVYNQMESEKAWGRLLALYGKALA